MSLRRNTLLIAIITIIAYGLLLPVTGFYWDDWPFAWIAKFLGPAEFIPAFMPFRPFLGPIFYLTTSLIPPVPLYWQVFALFIRMLIGLVAWWTFSQILPNRKNLALPAALLMLVFPGYSQHWVAYTHINQELIPFLFYLLSFGFTFKAIRTRKATDLVLTLLLQICGLFPTEYFFGLEGIRFLFLFFLLPGRLFERFSRAFKTWWPYLLIWMFNAAWLVYYYKFGPYTSYEVTATQSPNLFFFLTQAVDSLWKAGLYIWGQVLVLTLSSLPAPASLLTLGLIAVSFTLLTPVLLRSAQNNEPQERSLAVSLMLIGSLGILLGRLPSLAAGLPLTLQSSYDRFMISMMIGGTAFLLGLLEFFIKSQRARLIVLSVLVALGIGQQFFNANIFRRDWQKQGEIYWQMAWRMPALQPGTVLLTHQMPIDYETDLSFTAPINWMYAPEYTRSDLPYMLLYTEKRLGGSTLRSLEKGVEITYPYRTVDFHSSTSNAVVIYMPQNGCLRVLDPARGDAEIYSRQPEVLTQAIPLSDPSRILFDGTSSAQPMFFPEPEHAWCYYFTHVELSLQKGEVNQAVSFADKAIAAGYQPEDPTEWLLFVEAYARAGQPGQAEKLSKVALESDSKLRKGVCTVWEQIQTTDSAGSANSIESILLSFGCRP
ncbi:MAG TPA: hypothetical protein PKL78_03950 [Anaerolineales bacterium]|nr:hypothetical protein [Anaerolineales bacterium]HNO30203.1 hypothetical protein [Anaerolineales bacterium]